MGRGMIIGGVVAVLVVGGAAAAYSLRERESDDQKAVTIHASYVKGECGAATPIKASVDNGSDKTLKALSFDLDVYLDGDSTNLSGADGHETWTKIVKPHASASTCLPLPREARERIAKGAGRRSYTVRAEGHVAVFYAEGEYIPPEAPSASASHHP